MEQQFHPTSEEQSTSITPNFETAVTEDISPEVVQPETQDSTVEQAEQKEMGPAMRAHVEWQKKWYVRHNSNLFAAGHWAGILTGVGTIVTKLAQTSTLNTPAEVAQGIGVGFAIMAASVVRSIATSAREFQLYERAVREEVGQLPIASSHDQDNITELPLPSSSAESARTDEQPILNALNQRIEFEERVLVEVNNRLKTFEQMVRDQPDYSPEVYTKREAEARRLRILHTLTNNKIKKLKRQRDNIIKAQQ